MSRIFNGAVVGSYLSHSSTGIIPSGLDVLMYSAWIYPTSWGAGSGNGPGWIIWCSGHPDTGMFVSKSATGGGGTLTGQTSEKIYSTSQAVSVDSVLALNQWQFVAYVDNPTTGVSRLFVNGVEVSYASQTNGGAQNPQPPLMVGNNATSGTAGGFTGYIDSAGLWELGSPTGVPPTLAQFQTMMGYRGSLNAGLYPPNLLYNYWPLLGVQSPEPSLTTQAPSSALAVSNASLGPGSPGELQIPSIVTPQEIFSRGIQNLNTINY